jgi:hypothetical protein
VIILNFVKFTLLNFGFYLNIIKLYQILFFCCLLFLWDCHNCDLGPFHFCHLQHNHDNQHLSFAKEGRCGRDHMVDIQLPMQSEPITTKVVSLNPAHDEVYSIQYYVIRFVSDCDRSMVFSGYSGFLHQ